MTASVEDTKSTANATGADAGGMIPASLTPLQRGLMVLVGVLGALLIGGFFVLVGRLGYIAMQPSTPAAPAPVTPTTAISTPASTATLALLPDGASVTAMALDGNRLAVHYTLPNGPGGIAIIDLSSGKLEKRLQLAPSPPANR